MLGTSVFLFEVTLHVLSVPLYISSIIYIASSDIHLSREDKITKSALYIIHLP